MVKSNKLWKIIPGVLVLLLVIAGVCAGSASRTGDTRMENRPADVDQELPEDIAEGFAEERMIGELLGGIQVSGPTSEMFNEIYNRHQLEIQRIINDNPYMVWETLDLVIEALPALRRIPGNGGRLYLDKRTYAKASNLLAQYEVLSTPELAKDLKRARSLVESRTREADPNRVMIDLNR